MFIEGRDNKIPFAPAERNVYIEGLADWWEEYLTNFRTGRTDQRECNP